MNKSSVTSLTMLFCDSQQLFENSLNSECCSWEGTLPATFYFRRMETERHVLTKEEDEDDLDFLKPIDGISSKNKNITDHVIKPEVSAILKRVKEEREVQHALPVFPSLASIPLARELPFQERPQKRPKTESKSFVISYVVINKILSN